MLVLTGMFPREPGQKTGNFVLDQISALTDSDFDLGVIVATPWMPRTLEACLQRSRVDRAKYDGAAPRNLILAPRMEEGCA